MSIRPSIALHGITADDLQYHIPGVPFYLGSNGCVGIHLGAKPHVGATLYFDSPADFLGWYRRLGEMAAMTPALAMVHPSDDACNPYGLVRP